MGIGLIIDLIVVAFILLCVFYGYKKGLVNVGIRLVSFVIAIVISLILYRPITNLVIKYTPIDETIENTIVKNIDKDAESQNTSDNSPEKNILENTKNNLLKQTASSLSYNIIYAGVMILLFLLTRIILVFITALADWIAKLPIIKQFNKAGGILYGIVIGFAIVLVILLVLNFIASSKADSNIKATIDQTIITKILYENNLLSLFV